LFGFGHGFERQKNVARVAVFSRSPSGFSLQMPGTGDAVGLARRLFRTTSYISARVSPQVGRKLGQNIRQMYKLRQAQWSRLEPADRHHIQQQWILDGERDLKFLQRFAETDLDTLAWFFRKHDPSFRGKTRQ
jgi:hypothetical protein